MGNSNMPLSAFRLSHNQLTAFRWSTSSLAVFFFSNVLLFSLGKYPISKDIKISNIRFPCITNHTFRFPLITSPICLFRWSTSLVAVFCFSSFLLFYLGHWPWSISLQLWPLTLAASQVATRQIAKGQNAKGRTLAASEVATGQITKQLKVAKWLSS